MTVHTRTPYGFGDPRLASDVSDGVRLRLLFATLRAGWRTVFLTTLLTVTAGAFVAGSFAPAYRAEATVLLTPPAADRSVIPRPVRDDMAVLSSTALLGRVVDRLALTEAAGLGPRPGTAQGALLSAVARRGPTRRSRASATEILSRRLALTSEKHSGVVRIAFAGAEPVLAATIVNTLVAEYAAFEREAAAAASRETAQVLSAEVAALAKSVQDKELALESARSGLREPPDAAALKQVRAELAKNRMARDALRAHDTSVTAAMTTPDVDLAAVAYFRDADVIRRLRREASDLATREADLLAQAPDHPGRRRYRATREAIEGVIREEAKTLAKGLRIELSRANATVGLLEAEVGRLEEAAADGRRGAVRLGVLEREAEAARTLHAALLSRLEVSLRNARVDAPSLRVLSHATSPDRPMDAPFVGVVALALLLGVGAGSGTVLLRARLRDTVRSPDALAALTQAPVLATLPVAPDEGLGDLVRTFHSEPCGPLGEAARRLRTAVLPPKGASVVVFTGAVAGEGVSAAALLFALAAQTMGRDTLLIDADHRARTLSRLFCAHADGEPSAGDAVVQDGRTGLHVLVRAAEEGTNPADTLASPAFRKRLTTFATRYPLIVIDTPPLLEVTDGSIVAGLADTVIHTTRAGHSTCQEVREACSMLSRTGAQPAGYVMTLAPSHALARR